MSASSVSPETLHYILHHVFLPPKLPQEDDSALQPSPGDIAICQQAHAAASQYRRYLSEKQRTHWTYVLKMVANLVDTTRAFEKQDSVNKILQLEAGGMLAFHIRAQNACLLLHKNSTHIVFEAFEVAPPPKDVMNAPGKLLCSYPGPAIEVPLNISQDRSFIEQLVSFLCQMDVDALANATPTTKKAGSTVTETRSTADPKYITHLLTSILHGIGQEAKVERITKRIADEVCWNKARNPWRRTPLWLVLRVAVQRTCESREIYKGWMLFFHAQLLRLFSDNNFSSDLLYTARVKTARRAYKLRETASPQLLEMVKEVGQIIEERLQAGWSQQQQLHAPSPVCASDPATFESDTVMSLQNSRKYLINVLNSNYFTGLAQTFRPNHAPRLRDLSITALYPNGLATAVQADIYVALYDFEFLIAEQLTDWTTQNLKALAASQILNACLTQYLHLAKIHYGLNAEDQSRMILTTLDIWVSLDKIVCSQHPLLRRYSPEIPASILDPILLRHSSSLDRATTIANYLRRRHATAEPKSTPIYSSDLTQFSFSICFYDESSSLQDLMSSILETAASDRKRKLVELANMNDKHTQLIEQIDAMECTYIEKKDRYGYIRLTHENHCSKCSWQNQADSMFIDIHEWPLPKSTLEAKATVFELACPSAFSIWRTLTYQILRDIGMVHVSPHKSAAVYFLEEYEGLQRWKTKDKLDRVTFASETKSFIKTHYRNTRIPTTEDRICVNNGLCFKLYDKSCNETARMSFDIDIYPYCTLRLPTKTGPYCQLQYAVSYTTHPHNSTITKQSDCPINLNIHEQLAFSNLRCGPELQWMNIIRELRTKTLTLSRNEVHTLFMQAAWQIGPLSTANVRIWHKELEIPQYGLSLVRETSALLLHIEKNWMEANTAQTVIYLISRLLASVSDSQVFKEGCELLRKARGMTYQWMHQILSKLQSATENEDNISELQRRACEMAAICKATFDVCEARHLQLLSLPEDVSVLIECSIVIHDNTPSNSNNSSPDFQRLLDRDRQRRHFLETFTAEHIRKNRRGLDTAIKSVWPSYQPGSHWLHLPEPNSRWVVSSTTHAVQDGFQHSQEIHYNLLTGELLIDGQPLGRLPRKILSHPTYQRLFGQKIFDIIPANMAGMNYTTRLPLNGFQIYFAFHQRDVERLIIQAKSQSGKVYELIPHDVLAGDFPHIFTAECTHWMDVVSGTIEFRPLEQPWKRSISNWCLNFSANGPSTMYFKEKGMKHALIDIRCKTFQEIASCLNPLEYSKYLTIVLKEAESECHISVDLPRFGLSFFLNNYDQLESSNMHNMVVDTNQNTGTMIGLKTQLVLRHRNQDFASLPRSRLVIIPYGNVQCSISPDGNHVIVGIDTMEFSLRQGVIWFKYDIDMDLGLLVGNLSLTSHLFKIYLHAVCSHPLPDPLTGHRGTTYALQELGNARTFSFQQLTETDTKLLRLIGDISPKRYYYPNHLRVMQTTEWSPHLPVLSQHRLFDSAVSKIMDYAQSLTIFPELYQEIPPCKVSSDAILHERAGRQAIYHQGDILPLVCDRIYHSRDSSMHSSGGEMEASKVSYLVNAWPTGFASGRSGFPNILDIFKTWGTMRKTGDQVLLTYTKDWLSLRLSDYWLTIYETCRQMPDSRSKFELLFSFATLAYTEDPIVRQCLLVLLACATLHPFHLQPPPPHQSYDLSQGFEPLRARVLDIVKSQVRGLEDSPVPAELHRLPDEADRNFQGRLNRRYSDLSRLKIEIAVNRLMAEWPNPNPRSPFSDHETKDWFWAEAIMTQIKSYFDSCSNNLDLKRFASNVSTVLRTLPTSALDHYIIPQFLYSPTFGITHVPQPSFTLIRILLDRCKPILPRTSHTFGDLGQKTQQIRGVGQPVNTLALAQLADKFKLNHASALHRMYQRCLEKSQKELDGQQTFNVPVECTPSTSVCIEYRQRCQNRLLNVFGTICNVLQPISVEEEIIKVAGLWPSIPMRTVLQLLSSFPTDCLGDWPDILIALAEAFIEYQHSQRLVGFSLRSDVNNFFKELDNASFNWSDATKNPIWLTVQIEGNFIIRPLQSQVAGEMISPTSEQSITLQLNMGEGKSHVIVPLIAAALADSQKLVRIIVLKPLAKQMFQSLVERMSGLPNRRVFFLPFSRDIKPTSEAINTIRSLFEECVRVRGVLVTQPEHILSFKLMVVDHILSSPSEECDQNPAAKNLQAAQSWLTSTSRDVLDESDELLHVRYQLIYTRDQQKPFDGSPGRWGLTQKVFDLVREHMKPLYEMFPEEVELIERHDSANHKACFPHFRLLGNSASATLVSRVAQDILDGKLDSLTFVGVGSGSTLRSIILRFITLLDIDSETFRTVSDTYKTTGLWKGLLLLRGLLAHGILVYTLSSRRWRVDYGLDPKRSLLAVPFRAKDVPSMRSEFGHPDIVISLTCLTYYYGGLTCDQVKDCFDIVNKLDDPSLEYESWVKRGGDGVPLAIHQLIGVNMKDIDMFTTNVIPVFQYNKGTIDFYLSHVVFPKEAKEFPSKLGTSGWDLAEVKNHFTTGFSGTNDNSYLLPTSITQSDPVNQLRTNAQVLEYILRKENDRYLCTQGENGQPCSAAELLAIMARESQEIRVLLDVGAQMLEMSNRKLVEHWLSISSDAVQAGIFFDDSDNLTVLTRSGMVEPLHSSPFIQRIYQCIIYLDDSHTRGTDLKLPPKFRALVTLGPKVTKDKLVQGCMRMRGLGHGQTLVFCAPPEVDRQIRRVGNLGAQAPVHVVDVLCWAMSNTCNDIKDHIPHWVQQGLYYHNRKAGFSAFLSPNNGSIRPLKSTWLEPATRTLDEMYGSQTKDTVDMGLIRRIPDMRSRLRMFGVATVRDRSMTEEQEREVSHEMEEETQLERPPKVPAAIHGLDAEVRAFVCTGAISPDSLFFIPLLKPLFSAVRGTASRVLQETGLLGTRDFMTTTESRQERSQLTDYLRPVNWIVSYVRPTDGRLFLVVMSPFEVNALLGDIRKSLHVRLHIYAPRTSESMKSFNDLALYSVPPLPPNHNSERSVGTPVTLSNDIGAQLNLWAGQLYFDSYPTYLHVCLLLGLSAGEDGEGGTQDMIAGAVESDRFVPRRSRKGEMANVCLFDQSPVPVLQMLFALRKGMGFQSTHIGKVLQARLVLQKDFEK